MRLFSGNGHKIEAALRVTTVHTHDMMGLLLEKQGVSKSNKVVIDGIKKKETNSSHYLKHP